MIIIDFVYDNSECYGEKIPLDMAMELATKEEENNLPSVIDMVNLDA